MLGTAVLVSAAVAVSLAQAPKSQAPAQSENDVLRRIYPNLPPNQDPAAVARGKHLFEMNCAFCHGAEATGGNGGPDLLRSVLVNHDEKGNLIGPVVREGRISKGMPAFGFADSQVSDLVAFLHQRNRDARLRFTYTIPNVAVGDAKAGKVFFASHCAVCHSITGDLAGVAAKYAADDLQQRWLGPPPPPVQLTVTLSSGQSYSGTLEYLDEFSVSLYDAQGNYRGFARTPEVHVHVTDPLDVHHNLLEELTDRDMHNVTTYLETLK